MSPDPLTLARATPLGPYVPATEVMLRGWCGPVLVDVYGDLVPGPLVGPDVRPEAERAGPWTVYPCGDDWPDLHDAYKLARSCRTGEIRLDTRRKEVRWRLVDLGLLPDALRDHPGAAVAAGMGVRPTRCLEPWHGRPHAQFGDIRRVVGSVSIGSSIGNPAGDVYSRHWCVGDGKVRGPETGPAGKLAADLAALRLGCVLEEADGWFIPRPDGGVGFVAREGSDAV